MNEIKDVPSPIDLRNMHDARAWAAEVNIKRPYRFAFFEKMAEAITTNGVTPVIVELGSGPGFLANHLVERIKCSRYVALDFSEAMHQLAVELHPRLAGAIEFHLGDFKEHSWHSKFSSVDAVVTMQAVHELRHKDHAVALFQCVSQILRPGGLFLYCDHSCGIGAIQNGDLYMTDREKGLALGQAGFSRAELACREGTLSLWQAVK